MKQGAGQLSRMSAAMHADVILHGTSGVLHYCAAVQHIAATMRSVSARHGAPDLRMWHHREQEHSRCLEIMMKLRSGCMTVCAIVVLKHP